eukprot:scaffold23450_cov44-Cyclotella_meneghiniana.AAC.1
MDRSNNAMHYDIQTSDRTEKGYPLDIEVTTLKYEESSINREFILKLLPKVNYPALYSAVSQLCPHCTEHSLPELPEHLDTSDEAISSLDEDTIDTGRKFPVKDCIPNMILHEDEI